MIQDWTPQMAERVYAVLVAEAGAAPGAMESGFVHWLTTDFDPREWRFCGRLGFGGKYWPRRNEVDCYSEDLNPARKQVIERTNKALAALFPDQPPDAQ